MARPEARKERMKMIVGPRYSEDNFQKVREKKVMLIIERMSLDREERETTKIDPSSTATRVGQ